MTRKEVIEANREKLADKMRNLYRDVLDCDGRIEYSVYIWDDGEIETLEQTQGGNGWLKPKEWEDRKLFFVATIDSPFFDPWDCYPDPKPEDEEEAETIRNEIIDECVDDYDPDCYIDLAIEEDEYLDDEI